MNPHQKNKVDITSLSQDEQRLFRLYGKLPNKKDLLQNKLKERKYFDSGDYALSKAGKASDTGVTSIGTEHPHADNIPHASPLTHTISRGDSISSASPPNQNPSISTQGLPFGSAGLNDGFSPISGGPTPAGMHRGSINGIPGGGLPGTNVGAGRSPQKESYLAKSASMDQDKVQKDIARAQANIARERGLMDGGISPPPSTEGIPIKR